MNIKIFCAVAYFLPCQAKDLPAPLYKLLVHVFMTFLFWLLNHRLTPITRYFSWHSLFIY